MHDRIRSIIVGIADTRDGDPHLAPAARLAERLGAVLHVVHAFSPPDPLLAPPFAAGTSDPERRERLRDEVGSRLQPQVARLSEKAEVIGHPIAASPADAILEVAERERGDLVVVGASRRGALAGTMLGTTAQRVLRASAVPVVVKRLPDDGPPRRILLTTDLSELSARVHERGMELLAMLWGPAEAEVRSLLVAGDDVLLPPPLHQIAMREQAEARLDAFLERRSSGRRRVQGKVRIGLSAREILAEAAEWGAELLVLGTHGRTGVSRFLIGSVAEAVSRKAPCDVLLLPVAAIGLAGSRGSA